MEHNGVKAVSPNEISTLMANYYADLTVPDPKVVIADEDAENSTTILQSFTVSCEDVITAIKTMPHTTSSGQDGISIKFFKSYVNEISPILQKVFIKCFAESVVPDSLKVATVIPIYKRKGVRSSPLNYRPISILPTASKIMEKIVQRQICDYLDTNKLLDDCQHGFQKNLSTTIATMKLTEDIFRAGENKLPTTAVFIDLSKAFDVVSHAKLLSKMKSKGIAGTAFKWMESYLSDRYLQVKLPNATSQPVPLRGSVPQGSILGPILFNIYLDGIQKSVKKAKILMYADDIVLYLSEKLETVKNDPQTDLDNLCDWLDDIGMKINATKTKLMTFKNSTSTDLKIKIRGKEIELVPAYKYLGIWLDDKLSFKCHLHSVCKKMSDRIHFLNRHKSHFSLKFLKCFSDSLILSVSHYCLIIWGNLCKSDIANLDRLYNSIMKNLFPRIYSSSKNNYFDCLEKLNWPSAAEYRDFFMLQFFYKYYLCTERTKKHFQRIFQN